MDFHSILTYLLPLLLDGDEAILIIQLIFSGNMISNEILAEALQELKEKLEAPVEPQGSPALDSGEGISIEDEDDEIATAEAETPEVEAPDPTKPPCIRCKKREGEPQPNGYTTDEIKQINGKWVCWACCHNQSERRKEKERERHAEMNCFLHAESPHDIEYPWEYIAQSVSMRFLNKTLLTNMVRVAKPLSIEEVQLNIHPDAGISWCAMDPSHIALINYVIKPSALEKWNTDNLLGKKFTAVFRAEGLEKILKRSKHKDDRIDVAVDDCNMQIGIGNTISRTREFTEPLITSTLAPTPLPKLDLKTTFVYVKSAFEELLTDIATKSDHVTIESIKGGLFFSGGSDAGKSRVEVDKGDQDLLEMEVKENSKATFSLDWLQGVLKAIDIADTVKISYSTKQPIHLAFSQHNHYETSVTVDFYLAPRVEDR